VPGFSAIDQCRNQVATDALAAGFEELFWLDADTDFQPDALDRLRAHQLPIVSGIYPEKGQRALACRLLPDTKEVHLRRGGRRDGNSVCRNRLPVKRRREVYDAGPGGIGTCRSATSNSATKRAVFLPMIADSDKGPIYIADDFSFSHRARAAGYKIYAGPRRFGWGTSAAMPTRGRRRRLSSPLRLLPLRLNDR